MRNAAPRTKKLIGVHISSSGPVLVPFLAFMALRDGPELYNSPQHPCSSTTHLPENRRIWLWKTQKRFGRRVFLKSAAIAGVGLGLAACAPSAAPSGSEAAPSAEDERDHLMAWDEEGFDSFQHAEFTAETGIKVNQAVFPRAFGLT